MRSTGNRNLREVKEHRTLVMQCRHHTPRDTASTLLSMPSLFTAQTATGLQQMVVDMELWMGHTVLLTVVVAAILLSVGKCNLDRPEAAALILSGLSETPVISETSARAHRRVS